MPQMTTHAPPDTAHAAPLRALVDNVIEQGQQHGFSLEEIRLVIEERVALRERGLRIAFVGIEDAMRKYATLIQRSLGKLRATVSPVSLERLRESPKGAHRLADDYDLLVTLLFHYREVVGMTAGTPIHVLPIISELSNHTLESIALLPPDAKIGLVCHRTSVNNYVSTIRQYHPPEQEILFADPEDEASVGQLVTDAAVVLHTTVLSDFIRERVPPGLRLIELKHVPNSRSLDRVREHVAKMLGRQHR